MKKYKYPQKDTCYECEYSKGKCTQFPKEDWAEIWLTNQCNGFKSKTQGNGGQKSEKD